jgi:hypothetical protein
MRNQPSRSFANVIAAIGCLTLATAVGCGDDTGDGSTGNGGSGGGSSSSSSTSTGPGSSNSSNASSSGNSSNSSSASSSSSDGGGGTGGDGGAGVGGDGGSGVGGDGGSGVGGAGGAGGGPDTLPDPVLVVVGDPAWEIVDFHQISVEVGPKFSNFGNVINGLLPSPDHESHPDLGVGPGAAHDGFETELATNVAAEGYVDSAVFTEAEGLLPNGILQLYMIVPTAAAPTGSSPDFETGPILPNDIFPLGVEFGAYQDGELLEGYSFGFDVPALDGELDPPFDVDGHSHIPIFNAVVLDGVPELPGEVEVRTTFRDADGDGYDLSLTATVE